MITNLFGQQSLREIDQETNDVAIAEFTETPTDKDFSDDIELSEFAAGIDQTKTQFTEGSDEDIKSFDLDDSGELVDDLSDFEEKSYDDVNAEFTEDFDDEDLDLGIEDADEQAKGFSESVEDNAMTETAEPRSEMQVRDFDYDDDDQDLARLAKAGNDDEAMMIEATMIEPAPDQEMFVSSAEEVL